MCGQPSNYSGGGVLPNFIHALNSPQIWSAWLGVPEASIDDNINVAAKAAAKEQRIQTAGKSNDWLERTSKKSGWKYYHNKIT